MHPGELVYETALRAAPTALRLVAPFHGRLRRALQGRRDSARALHEWARLARTDDRPLAWLHAPSVGEALMAQAILAALKQREPAMLSVFTYFSPSAERIATRVGADWSGYLPWDQRSVLRPLLHELRPTHVAFVRTEIWPVLGREAARLGARVVLVNAVLAEHSSRLGAGARAILGPAYGRLHAVGAVAAEDIPRFGRLGVRPERVRVTGDARFDQVWARVQHLDRERPLLRALAALPGPRLVAGSTWEADEAALIPALLAVRAQGVQPSAVVAPHEPAPQHLARLEERLRGAGLSHARMPGMDSRAVPACDVLVVDTVGVLADLYAVADVAYVGGGFGTAGLHSVVEPAALGVPVVYGPRHGHAREAALLAAAAGGFVAADAAALQVCVTRLFRDERRRLEAGAAARAFVASHVGGAQRNARLLLGRDD